MLIHSADEVVAKHVLQVNVLNRAGTPNVRGSFVVWNKEGRFGHADQLMRFCPGEGCTGVIRMDFELTPKELEQAGEGNEGDMFTWPASARRRMLTWYADPVVCPCDKYAVPREELPDSYLFNMTVGRIADRMVEIFDRLGRDADIYLVRSKHEKAFHKAREELHAQDMKFSRYLKKLDKARDRECVLYPMASIIKDTVDASSLASKFKSLLSA